MNNMHDKIKLKDVLWDKTAQKIRTDIYNEIHFLKKNDIKFFDYIDTMRLGNIFWNKVSNLLYKKMNYKSFTEIKNNILDREYRKNNRVVFFHRYSNDCGGIRIKCDVLCDNSELLQKKLGPDFLFMSLDFKFGFCFEKDEHDLFLRQW